MKLSDQDVQTRLHHLAGWNGDSRGITRSFEFDSYEAGVAFAVQVALIAQKDDHHPDALTIGWKRVVVTYVTHSAGGVTEWDFEAAARVDALSGPR